MDEMLKIWYSTKQLSIISFSQVVTKSSNFLNFGEGDDEKRLTAGKNASLLSYHWKHSPGRSSIQISQWNCHEFPHLSAAFTLGQTVVPVYRIAKNIVPVKVCASTKWPWYEHVIIGLSWAVASVHITRHVEAYFIAFSFAGHCFRLPLIKDGFLQHAVAFGPATDEMCSSSSMYCMPGASGVLAGFYV